MSKLKQRQDNNKAGKLLKVTEILGGKFYNLWENRFHETVKNVGGKHIPVSGTINNDLLVF